MSVIEVKLPQQGATMTDGDLVEWKVEIGERVEAGQEIAEIDTAKTTFPVTAPVAGIIRSFEKSIDDNVLVGEVIATIETDSD
jgi:2-oxoglutarate dehydrogenase E2 component (dihydrolipoamide succinyltransferase)